MIGRIGILALLAFGFVCVACGSDDDKNGNGSAGGKCEQACQKLESCNPGSVCQINGECTGGNEKIADCILGKECNEMQSCFLGGG
jgi:hypothetical protein